MKKILFTAILLISGFVSMAAGRVINEKLVQTFRETYPNAIEISWLEYSDSYSVNFKEGEIRATIIFNRDGRFLRSTRYYTEKYLPYYLIAAIHEKYPGKKIYSVSEISTSGEIHYYIKLEDAKTWMTIKVDSDEYIRVLEKFRKA
jgi:hypothetical protein